MRRSIALFLLVSCAALAVHSPAAAGPIRVGVEPTEDVSGPVLVRVSGHYISLHNGISHHWKDDFIPIGGRHFIPLGPVNPLINVGVSVRIVHPELISAHARSHSTPLLLRPVGFETFEPRTWRDVMAHEESRFGERPKTPAGHVLPQAYQHLKSILEEYLPAYDVQPDASMKGDPILHQLELFEELVRYALDAPAPVFDLPRGMPQENRPSYVKSLRERHLMLRVEIEEIIYQLREWLSLDRAERRHIRNLMDGMRHAKHVAAQLLTDADWKRLGDYMNEVEKSRARKQDYQKGKSWSDPTTGIAYRVRMLEPRGECAELGISVDLTGLVKADLGNLIHSVKGRFCRDADGTTRYGQS
jgi:hypothetical protein